MLKKIIYFSVCALVLSSLAIFDLSAQYDNMPGSDPKRSGELYDELLDKAGVRSNRGSSTYRERPRNRNDRYNDSRRDRYYQDRYGDEDRYRDGDGYYDNSSGTGTRSYSR